MFHNRNALFLLTAALIALGCILPSSGQPAANTKILPPEKTRASKTHAPETSSGATKADAAEADAAEADASVPPLYFFYVVHAHSSDEYLPFTDPSQTTVDANAASNMGQIFLSMQEVLDKHGLNASWHVTASMAKGFCPAVPGESVFRRLQNAGHEIGAHAHKRSEIQPAYLALTQNCGITPKVISGLLMEAAKVQGALAQATLSDAFEQSVALGMTMTTENLAPGGGKNPFDNVCSEFGVGNDMWGSTGNLMFPWRPDYAAKNICTEKPAGSMLLVNHVSIEAFIVGGQMPDVLTTASFAQLQDYLDGALAYMAANKPDRPAVWGFVTHIIEYGPGNGTSGPDPAAIAALDSFLAYAESLRDQGRLVFATVQEIADAVAA